MLLNCSQRFDVLCSDGDNDYMEKSLDLSGILKATPTKNIGTKKGKKKKSRNDSCLIGNASVFDRLCADTEKR